MAWRKGGAHGPVMSRPVQPRVRAPRRGGGGGERIGANLGGGSNSFRRVSSPGYALPPACGVQCGARPLRFAGASGNNRRYEVAALVNRDELGRRTWGRRPPPPPIFHPPQSRLTHPRSCRSEFSRVFTPGNLLRCSVAPESMSIAHLFWRERTRSSGATRVYTRVKAVHDKESTFEINAFGKFASRHERTVVVTSQFGNTRRTPATATTALAFHQVEPGSIPGVVAPGFSHVGNMPDGAASQRFSRGSPFSPSLSFQRCSTLTSLHPHRLSGRRNEGTATNRQVGEGADISPANRASGPPLMRSAGRVHFVPSTNWNPPRYTLATDDTPRVKSTGVARHLSGVRREIERRLMLCEPIIFTGLYLGRHLTLARRGVKDGGVIGEMQPTTPREVVNRAGIKGAHVWHTNSGSGVHLPTSTASRGETRDEQGSLKTTPYAPHVFLPQPNTPWGFKLQKERVRSLPWDDTKLKRQQNARRGGGLMIRGKGSVYKRRRGNRISVRYERRQLNKPRDHCSPK
ncbi:hypothetical protein PR048_007791 [Dryococelus australis]|uniref:Ribosomal protein L2 n=1 Tax=Dryococelus australis TaxID=614101 RepID=A0ABQ9HV92_9NEOP|nr:hypothetical protein PR048_007791 [Dryococelus australis]